ncbi:hypothetical protein VK90_14135 [Bacillus sp. LK2]|nr:hypothetical protein VK90_14135 [Bacillus sp. LK2]
MEEKYTISLASSIENIDSFVKNIYQKLSIESESILHIQEIINCFRIECIKLIKLEVKIFLNRFQFTPHEYSFEVSCNDFEGTVSSKQFKENNIESLLLEIEKQIMNVMTKNYDDITNAVTKSIHEVLDSSHISYINSNNEIANLSIVEVW